MTRIMVVAMTTAILLFNLGCSTAPKTEEDKAALEAKANAAVRDFKTSDPSIEKSFFKSAEGYAVFPVVGKGALGVGGAYGRGVLYEDDEIVGYCDLLQGSIGFQAGGQAYREFIFFETPESLAQFKAGTLEFAAQASAVAAAAGAGANAKYEYGVAVFTMGEKGLMYEASIGGQHFSYVKK